MDTFDVSWNTPVDARECAAVAVPQEAPDDVRVHSRWKQGLPQGTVLRIHDYMATHIGESISLESLARVACMSRFHFARRFRQSTGCSPMAFLLRMRIERARGLLADGDTRIADIAAELGFFDQSHFTRTFRRTTGMSPRAYARAQVTLS
ncbi:helix-turn-helix domain-containing protein [Lysobacter niastensis]|uniref:Helix-turn-helix transcriptional regulator n=1 Tax=Lysobacter niastensis TaxID=380629 RepID=A0ABS0B5Y0_9GAMM|nr:AraC family transcriptional regulator [Lysobacter niastensis]MBF6024323.1 helix-turn-helix transcriptional regulator [Lysobacter niastensis]